MEPTDNKTPFSRDDRDLLIRLDEKMNGLLEKITPLAADHESRLRTLERWRWIVIGVASGLSAILNYAVQALQLFRH